MRGTYLRGVIYIAGALVALLVGFAMPTYFRAVAPETLVDMGEGTHSLTDEADRLVSAAKVGPYHVLKQVGLPDSQGLDQRMNKLLSRAPGPAKDSVFMVAGTASAVDIDDFHKYFGGLDPFNREKGRNAAFFVFNHAYRKGVLKDWLESKSNNRNVKRVLDSVPRDGRPGAFWPKVVANPLIREKPGLKLVDLEGFRFFPNRSLLLSVVIVPTHGFSEEEIELALSTGRRQALQQLDAQNIPVDRFFLTKADGAIQFETKDNLISAQLTVDSREIGSGMQDLFTGAEDDGFRTVILGGVIGPDGHLERHGRWLPYPMLVPMMLGTAMLVETGYLNAGSDPGYELGNLSHAMLQGDLASKERLRKSYWSIFQLASRFNWGQLAELLHSCPDLQAIDDMAALVRMTTARPSELKSRLKRMERKIGDGLGSSEAEEVAVEIKNLQRLLVEAQRDSEIDLGTVYVATLLSDDPSSVLRYVREYPGNARDADARALADLRFAMQEGKGGLDYLLDLGLPIYEPSWALSVIAPLFPKVGGDGLISLSLAHRKTAFVCKGISFTLFFVFTTMALTGFFSRISPQRNTQAAWGLRVGRNLSIGAFGALAIFMALEPPLLETSPVVSRAGFDFSFSNLIANANGAAEGTGFTLVTALFAGGFLLLQSVIYSACLISISKLKKKAESPSLKLKLLDNEDNFFDLGLYVGLGGTVLSLALLIQNSDNQDALVGAYSSTLFGILFVAILKIFHVRPYRKTLLRQGASKESRNEP